MTFSMGLSETINKSDRRERLLRFEIAAENLVPANNVSTGKVQIIYPHIKN